MVVQRVDELVRGVGEVTPQGERLLVQLQLSSLVVGGGGRALGSVFDLFLCSGPGSDGNVVHAGLSSHHVSRPQDHPA